MNATTRHNRERDIEGLVAIACRLVGSNTGVRGVRILTRSRQLLEGLRWYQKWARNQHVRLHLDVSDVITMRPEREAQSDR